MGGSSRLCAALEPGEPIVLMGPTGQPTEIAKQETVLLCGGGLGNAVLFSIARAFKLLGGKVLYFAGYRRGDDLFKRDDIERCTDQVIWCTDVGAPIEPHRPQDQHFRGNIVQAMVAYGTGRARRAAVHPAARGEAHHRHRQRPHDERRARGAPRRARAAARPAATSPSAASTRRCSA